MIEAFDEMWQGGPRLLKNGAFPVGTDSVLLSDFAKRLPAKKICDLGCGSGLISLLLLWEKPGACAVGVEIDSAAAETARRNAEENGLSSRFRAVCADMRQWRGAETAGAFDLTVSNPPYYKTGSGFAAAGASRALARGEGECTLSDAAAAAAYVTKWGGSFCMVHKPERMSEALCVLTAAGLEPKRLRIVQKCAGAAPSLFLVDARRGGKPGLIIEPPLILTENGADSAEVRRIYRR